MITAATRPLVALVTLGSLTLSAQAPAPVGCQRHLELYGSGWWAKELGRTEQWTVANYRIAVWQNPSGNRGRRLGALLPGSRAVILEETPEAYRVRSPLDQSVGWVSRIQVVRTLHQDVTTREPCTPKK